jgi:hypothetical protein
LNYFRFRSVFNSGFFCRAVPLVGLFLPALGPMRRNPVSTWCHAPCHPPSGCHGAARRTIKVCSDRLPCPMPAPEDTSLRALRCRCLSLPPPLSPAVPPLLNGKSVAAPPCFSPKPVAATLTLFVFLRRSPLVAPPPPQQRAHYHRTALSHRACALVRLHITHFLPSPVRPPGRCPCTAGICAAVL